MLTYRDGFGEVMEKNIVFENIVFKIGNDKIFLVVVVPRENHLDITDFQDELAKTDGAEVLTDVCSGQVSIILPDAASDTEIIRVYSLLKRYL